MTPRRVSDNPARVFRDGPAHGLRVTPGIVTVIDDKGPRVSDGSPTTADGNRNSTGFVQLKVEDVSFLLASKLVDDRDVVVRLSEIDTASEAGLTPLSGAAGELSPLYEGAARQAFAAHRSVLERLAARVDRPRAAPMARGLLPAGTRTSLELAGSVEGVARTAARLLASPLPEAQTLGTSLEEKLAAQRGPSAPRIVANAYDRTVRDRVPHLASGAGLAGTDEGETTEQYGLAVRMMRYDPDALSRVAKALAYEDSDALWNGPGLAASIGRASPTRMQAFVRGVTDGRPVGEPLPRAFDVSSLSFELTIEFASYLELPRPSGVTPFAQRLTCLLGPEIPPSLDEHGLSEAFRSGLGPSEEAWAQASPKFPLEAQYFVPLAYRFRALWTVTLGALAQLVETPTRIDLTRVTRPMLKQASNALPWMRDVVTES